MFTYARADSFALCNYNCRSTVERTVWDGDQVLYELRTDGNSNLSTLDLDRNYITGLAYGKAGYVHAGGIDRPLFMTDGRVPNYNWRGLVESSSWADGAPADCSIMTGTCTTIAWAGKVGVYMKPGPGGSAPNAAQWVGNVIQNGAGSTGLLFRRNRSFDPSTGQFTQQDPIGIAGGANVYGFAGGDPINFSDPFGLCPIDKPLCQWLKATLVLIGTDIGMVGGGGVGLAGIVGGPAAAATVPAGAMVGAALGASIGVAAGGLVDAMFSESAGSGGGGGPAASESSWQITRRSSPTTSRIRMRTTTGAFCRMQLRKSSVNASFKGGFETFRAKSTTSRS